MKNIFSKKQIIILVTISMVSGVLFFRNSIFVDAAINPLLDFQGKVINSDGSNVANGVYDFEFKIYDDSVGGTLLWSEDLNASSSFSGLITGSTVASSSITYTFTPTQATSTLRVGQYLTNASASSSHAIITDIDTAINELSVERTASGTAWNVGDIINNRPRVDGGVVMLNLGTVSDLTTLDFNTPMFLETTFDGETMQPRKPFTSVTQSFNSSLLDGKSEADFASLAEDETVTGQWSFTDIVNMTASSTNPALSITQNGSGDLVEIKNGGTTAFSVLANGRVAIGSYIMPAADGFPGYVLKSDGSGNVSWQVDLAGFGGNGLWATSSNSRIIRPVDTSQVVVVGNTATSSDGYIFEVDGSSLFDNVAVSDENELRFYDAGNTNYFALKASSTLGSNTVFTLPTNSYVNEDSLMVDASGNMFWGKRAGLWGDSGSAAYYTNGNILIGTSTDNSLLTVGANSGSQFLVNSTGEITEGVWNGTVIDTPYGGTGRSNWSQYAIPYLTGTSTFGEVTIGTGNYLLGVNPGATGYAWIDPGTVGLNQEEVEDTAGNLMATTTGTHSLISVLYNDATSNMDFIVEDNLSLFSNASSSFVSTNDLFNNIPGIDLSTSTGSATFSLDGNYVIPLNASTTEWAEAYGWGNHSDAGYFVKGSDLLTVAEGGTGTSTFQANSLLYASAQNIIGEVLQGINGNILQSVSGVPTWVSTSSLGIDFNAIGGMLDPSQGGTGQDTSAWTGLPFVTGGAWSELSVLPVANGGTGSTSLDNLITLGTHTTGNYLADVAGGDSITVTGSLGEGVTRTIDVTDDSITPAELNVSGNGANTNILTSDGSGGFTWVAQGTVGTDTTLTQEQVEDIAGPLMATTTGTHTLITVTYDDTNNNMDFVVDNDLSHYDNNTTAFISRSGISNTATGLTYTPATGVLSMTAGYEIPTTANTLSWTNTANTVSASSSDWTQAFNWGDHSTAGYFSTSSGDILGIANGGTGATDATSARTSLGLGSLSTKDKVNNDDWLGTDLAVANGGTGRSSWTQYGIPYMIDSTTFGQIGIGATNTLLQVNATGDGFVWKSAGEVGVDTTLSQEEVEDYVGGMIGTTSLITITYNDNIDGKIEYAVTSDLSLFDNSVSQFFSTTTDVLDIAYGGTGAVNAAGARANLGLDDVATFGINATGTNGQVWQSDGDGRGHWVATSSLGIAGAGGDAIFVGTTTLTTNGSFSTSTLVGYQAGNQLCDDEFSGSFMCRTYDILATIQQGDISTWAGTAWVAEGPPGYTSNSNDCQGWTSNSNTMLGAFWALDSAGGGMGWLTNCEVVKPIACCSAQ